MDSDYKVNERTGLPDSIQPMPNWFDGVKYFAELCERSTVEISQHDGHQIIVVTPAKQNPQ